jgi:putative aldouronate transport system substrate-binding protein
MKRMCFLVLAVSLCAETVFAGGGRQGAASGTSGNSAAVVTPNGQLPIVNQPITLTLGVTQTPNVTDYTNNHLTRYFQEKTGVTIKFQAFANGNDAHTQLELMVSSNEKLPDIITWAPPNWKDYGDTGVFIDLAPFFEKYGYFFNQRLTKIDPLDREMIRIRGTTPGGKRAAFMLYNYSTTQIYRSNNFINKTWLDNLGLKMPTTTEEFYNTLVAFRDMDPNKNGRKDEIPFVGTLTAYASEPLAFLINAFVYYPLRSSGNDFLNVTNGKLWTPFTTEEYREAMRYISRLYREGLIVPSTFTMNQPELIPLVSTARGETSTVGFFSAHQNQVLLPETPAIFDFTYQVALTGPNGVNYYPMLPTQIDPNSFITKDSAYPEAAFRFLDFASSADATMTARYGEMGVDWRWVPASEKAQSFMNLPATFEQINMIWGVPQNKHWALNIASMFVNEENTEGLWIDDGSWNSSRYKMYQQFYINNGKDVPERVDIIVYTKEEEDQIRDLRNSLNTYRAECLSLFSTGQMNLDRDWNTYLAELDKIGLQRFLEIAQRAYTRTVGK